MRLPVAIPPTPEENSKLIESDPLRFVQGLMEFPQLFPDEEYEHWDKFRYKSPTGYAPAFGWGVLKFLRLGKQKFLSLGGGKYVFRYAIPDSLGFRIHQIDCRIGGGLQTPDSLFGSGSNAEQFKLKNLLFEESITSSQLEGASTTRLVAAELLANNLPPKTPSEQMILNNYRLMKRVVELKDEPFSLSSVLDLHRIATINALENDVVPGALRTTDDVRVKNLEGEIMHAPPPAAELSVLMEELCAFANDNAPDSRHRFLHPLLRAMILHFLLAWIHPFADGNGRTARALFYWSGLRSGYWPLEFLSISKEIKEARTQYDHSFLHVETDELDLTYFLFSQTRFLENAVESLHQHLKKKQETERQYFTELAGTELMNQYSKEQLLVIREAAENPGKRFSAGSMVADYGISENTARKFLEGLMRDEWLLPTKMKGVKTQFYVAPSGVKERLRELLRR